VGSVVGEHLGGFSPCSLAFQEYLLIGVAAECFPGELLNEEGVNRRAGAEE
jgi:hypothetical protein